MKLLKTASILTTALTVFPLAAAEISVGAGQTTTIDAAVAAPEGVLVTNTFVRPARVTVENVYPQRTAKRLLADAQLGEWRVCQGHVSGLGYVDDDVLPYNVVRGDGTTDVQLQSRSGLFLRCLKVRLVQNGDDIDIVYVYSRFIRSDLSLALPGVNFDAVPLAGDGVAGTCAVDCDLKYALANPPTSSDGQAFGLSSLTLQKVGAEGTVRLAAPLTTAGTMTVSDNVAFRVVAGGSVNGGSVTNALALGGEFSIADQDAPVTVSGDVSDAVSFDATVAGEEWAAQVAGKVKPTYLIKDATLGQLKTFRDVNLSGSSTGSVFFVESDGLTATMQFQGFFNNQYTACCFLTLTQQGSDVLATMTKAVYIWDRHSSAAVSDYFGRDFRGITPSGNWDYCVTAATMVMERAPTFADVPSGIGGGAMRFGGRTARVTSQALPGALKKDNKTTPRTVTDKVLCMLKGCRDINVSGSATAEVFFVENTCGAASMQVHAFFKNSYTACCFVNMQQSGADVVVRQTNAVYYAEKVASVADSQAWGRDFTTLATKGWDFGVTAMTLDFDVPCSHPFGELKLNRPITLRNVSLSDLRGVGDFRMFSPPASGAFWFHRDGDEAVVQLQGQWNNLTACCYVRFTQTGSDLVVTMTKSCFIYDSDAPYYSTYYGNDFDNPDIQDKLRTWDYWPQGGELLMAGTQSVVSLDGENTVTGGRISVVSNAVVNVAGASALPANGTVEIGAGARVYLDANNSADRNQSFFIRGGGVLRQGDYGDIADPYRTYLVFEGGELELSEHAFSYADDSGFYANFYTFAGGGSVSGTLKPRLLGYGDGHITVTGATPVDWTCGGLLLGGYNRTQGGTWTLYVDVADASGDATPDFITSGKPFREWGTPDQCNLAQRAVICKRGVGTWRMDAANPYLTSDLVVDAGTLVLNGDDLIPVVGTNSCGVTLSGGTLELTTGTSNTLQGLTLGESSVLRLADGATLSIGDSRAMTWADGATLEIQGDLGRSSVRFGTSQDALTSRQRRALRYNGHRMRLDEDGRVVNPYGMMLFVK